MLIEQKTMDQIHRVQLEMWDVLSALLNDMGITYYFVHGSLLGAVTKNGFIDEDDDIDIAIFRKDYDRLIKEGNDKLPSRYFIQSSVNDDFPLSFAKFRDSSTTFMQPVLKNYKCNQGIYIDIFPIDYCIENRIKATCFGFKELLLSAKINSRMNVNWSQKSRILNCIAKILHPSYKKAVKRREEMYMKLTSNKYVGLSGGKKAEQKIPIEWFNSALPLNFCGRSVLCPSNYQEYLSAIYGNEYLNYNPAGQRISVEKKIEISADILDFDKSYLEYNA